MRLSEAIYHFLLDLHLNRFQSAELAGHTETLASLWGFTGELEIEDLEAIHLMIYLSAERTQAIRRGESPTSPAFQHRYEHLRQFTHWLQLQNLVEIKLPDRLSEVSIIHKKPNPLPGNRPIRRPPSFDRHGNTWGNPTIYLN